MSRGSVVLLVCCILAASGGPLVAVGGAVPVDDPATDLAPQDGVASEAAPGASAAEIRLHRTLSLLPDRPGEVRLHYDVTVPDGVTRLDLYLPEGAVTGTDGFERVEAGRYEWTGADDPSLSLRIPVNRTASGPRIGDSGYTFVDTGEWALVRVPSAGVGWSERSGTAASVVRTTAVDGPGATGGEIAYLGAVERYERTAHGQEFDLVVPDRADLSVGPDQILDSLASASDALRIGDRDSEVFVVAAPEGDVEWGVRGLQTGPNDAWVRAGEPVNDPANVWLHEYVHTRQAFETTEDARWVTEGSADYLAALLTLQQGRIDYSAFRDQLALGTRSTFRDAVLTDPSTWEDTGANYRKGALVLGVLDTRMRLATDGDRGVRTVLSAMNDRSEPASATVFESLVADGNDSLAADAGRFTGTTDAPDPPTLSDYRTAFDTDPSAIELVGLEASLRGPYRNRSVAITDGDPRRLAERPVVGERVSFDVTLQNAGGSTGTYDLALRVDGERRDGRSVELAPGESRTVTVSVAVPDGDAAVRIGDRTLTLSGRRPAPGTVEDLTVDPASVAPGETVSIGATVAAPDDRPAKRTLRFVVGDRVVDERTVHLDAGERRTPTVTTTVDDPGRYRVGVADGPTADLSVGAETATPAAGTDRDGTGPASIPGPGPVGALLAVVLAIGGGLARRRS